MANNQSHLLLSLEPTTSGISVPYTEFTSSNNVQITSLQCLTPKLIDENYTL